MVVVNNEKDLLNEVKNEEEEITLVGDCKDKIAQIFNKDSVSWLVAVSSICALTSTSVSSSVSDLVSTSFADPLIGIFGVSLATYLLGIVLSNGVIALRNLREKYVLSEVNDERIVLRIKNN